MEKGGLNDLRFTHMVGSPVYQDDQEPGLCNLQNDQLLNYIGPLHYTGAGHVQSPIFYGTLVNPIHVMPYEPQYNFIQEPQLYRNFVNFGYNYPVTDHSHYIWEPCYNDVKYPEQFDSYQYRDYRSYDSNMYPHSNLGHNMLGGFSSSGHNLGGTIHGTNFTASSSVPFNVDIPMSQGSLQHYVPKLIDRKCLDGYTDTRYVDVDCYECFQCPVSGPSNSNKASLGNMNQARLFRIASENTTVARTPDKQNFTDQQHGYKSTIRTSPTELYIDPPTVRARGSTDPKIQSGQQGEARKNQPTQRSKHSTPPVKKSGSYTTPGPLQVWQRKDKTKPSQQVLQKKDTKTSKKSSKRRQKGVAPVHHIVWNIGVETSEQIGQYCPLCECDLADTPTYPTDEASEFSNLPAVAVFPCGHAFHSECLLLVTCEERHTDPPCFICINGSC